jgi:hypothetical protein
VVSSLSSGHGESAVQGRLRYADSRDDNNAAGFAELHSNISRLNLTIWMALPYLETESLMFDRTAASSLMRCGLLPVFSSCSITPTTISSEMPSVSTLLISVAERGEGGGVFSYAALPLLFGLAAKETALAGVDVLVDDRDLDGIFGDGESEVCDRLIFLIGGCCEGDSVTGEALTEGR